MPNVPIDPPPGMYRNGTEYAAAGRWRDGNLVRFFRGTPQPVGGWTTAPLDTEVVTLPQYVEYTSATDSYDGTFTSSGNAFTVVLRFNTTAPAGQEFLITVRGGVAGEDRVQITVNDPGEAAPLRGIVNVRVWSAAGPIVCNLGSTTGYSDGEDHMLFFAFDGDNGLATFVIDGMNADDASYAGRLAPTAATLDGGASTIIAVGALVSGGVSPNYGGFIGNVGYDEQYLTNWADFMDGNLPKPIDETTWAEWASQPMYWAEDGVMTAHAGSEANLTATGTPTLVDSDELFNDILPGFCRRMVSWRDLDDQRWLAIGTTRGLFAWSGSTVYDITPTGLPPGEQGVVWGPGYGSGLYGTESYGTLRTQVINTRVLEPGAWALDTWGANLVGIPNWDGDLYEWDPSTPSTVAARVTGDVGTGSAESPEENRSLVVTNERHLVLFGAGDFGGVSWTANPRKIWWCSSEDNTTWAALATNSAGDLELKTDGIIQAGIRFGNEVIIWTTVDAHRMVYIGAPFYYSVRSIGAKAGIVGQTAYVGTDNFVFWVGPEGFYIYDGAVRELEPDVWDFYIDRVNKMRYQEIAVGHNPRFNEIWIFYPANAAIRNDSYIIWNYQDNTWSTGELRRSAWHEALIFDNPIAARPSISNDESVEIEQAWTHDTDVDVISRFESLGEQLFIQPGTVVFLDPADGTPYGTEDTDYRVDYLTGNIRTLSTGAFANNEYIVVQFTLQGTATPNTLLFFHEDGYTDEKPGTPNRDSWIELAPFEIGHGDRLAVVERIIQDTGREDDLDPLLNSNAVQVEFDTRLAPEGSVETHGPYTLDTTRGYTDCRFTGRQVTFRVRQAKNELWRVGKYRLKVKQGSMR